ncbi:hypothetical protein ACA910_009567 [Epithemia clementina (nom. ined.)]
MQDAKKVDPQTRRTLSVITKPDLVDQGAESGVLDLLLRKKTDGFERGFHMIKSRGQSDLDQKVSIRQGLKEEEQFFLETDPWKRVADQSLFGTAELRRKVGALQMEMSKSNFPAIVQEVKQQHQEAQELLNSMTLSPATLLECQKGFHLTVEEYLQQLKAHIMDGKCAGSDTGMHSVAVRFFNRRKWFKEDLNDN